MKAPWEKQNANRRAFMLRGLPVACSIAKRRRIVDADLAPPGDKASMRQAAQQAVARHRIRKIEPGKRVTSRDWTI